MRNFLFPEYVHITDHTEIQLKSIWEHCLEYSKKEWVDIGDPFICRLNHSMPIAYDPSLLESKLRGGLTYLLINDYFPNVKDIYIKPGRSFDYNKITRKQKISDNFIGNTNYNLLIATWPRDKYQFLIVSNLWRPQEITIDDSSFISNILDNYNYKIYFNQHDIVLNHWHMHLVVKKANYSEYIDHSAFRLKYFILEDKNFLNIFEQLLSFIKKNRSGYSIHFTKQNYKYVFYIIYKDTPVGYLSNIVDTHANGIICVKDRKIFCSL